MLLLGTVLLLGACSRVPDASAVHDGVLDLSDVDLRSQVVSLEPGWDMHWRKFLSPQDFSRGKFDPHEAIHMPRLVGWSRIPVGTPLPDTGFCTYRLRLRLDTSKIKRIAFAMREQASAYRLWANGVPILAGGTPAASAAEERPGSAAKWAEMDVTSPITELVVHVSNHEVGPGGMVEPPLCAAPARLWNSVLVHFGEHALSVGILLLLFWVYVLSWLFNRSERVSLHFSLFVLAWTAVLVTEGGDRLVPVLLADDSFDLVHRLQAIGFASLPILWYLFLRCFIPGKVVNACIRVFGVLGAAVEVVVLFSAPPFYERLLWAFMLLTLVSRPITIVLLARVARMRGTEIWILLAGYVVYTFSTANDILNVCGWLRTAYVSDYGLFVLVLAMASTLSLRMARTQSVNGRLAEEMGAKNIELERLSKVKDDFLAATTHELRTPLHGIVGISEAALACGQEEKTAPTAMADFRSILASARRLSRLVDDLLDFSRMRRADQDLRLENVDLAAAVAGVVRHFDHDVRRNGLALESILDDDLPAVQADADRLEQILFNLVGNAVKFTNRGCVRIKAWRDGDRVLVGVGDDGPGVPARERQRIFEAFEQGSLARGGMGLGLAISQRLVQLHGGRLELRQEQGAGARFVFDLRIAPPVETTSNTLLSVSDANACGDTPVTVMAIDDEPVNLRILRSHLQSGGYRVVCAEHGLDALARIEKEKPSLLLLDVMMPGKDGFEVCREIRGRWSAAQLPILFVTARDRMDDVVNCFAVGGNDFLVKPFLREELLTRVRLHLGHSGQEPAHGLQSETSIMIHEIMQHTVRLWEISTHSSRADFAENSGLWKVHMDANGWRRTQTLDRYLDRGRNLQRPQLQAVIESACYVIDLCSRLQYASDEVENLRNLVSKIKQ